MRERGCLSTTNGNNLSHKILIFRPGIGAVNDASGSAGEGTYLQSSHWRVFTEDAPNASYALHSTTFCTQPALTLSFGEFPSNKEVPGGGERKGLIVRQSNVTRPSSTYSRGLGSSVISPLPQESNVISDPFHPMQVTEPGPQLSLGYLGPEAPSCAADWQRPPPFLRSALRRCGCPSFARAVARTNRPLTSGLIPPYLLSLAEALRWIPIYHPNPFRAGGASI